MRRSNSAWYSFYTHSQLSIRSAAWAHTLGTHGGHVVVARCLGWRWEGRGRGLNTWDRVFGGGGCLAQDVWSRTASVERLV